MSTQQSGSAGNQSQHGEPTTSLGHRTSGEAGATPEHETMQETGGSGGAGLTANQSGPDSSARQQTEAPASRQGELPEPQPGPVLDSGARGAQDTRSRQAGSSGTGLGTPETGANQRPEDMEHGRGPSKRGQ